VGAWQHCASCKAYFECRYSAELRQWSVYLLLSVPAESEASLPRLVVSAHDALQQWSLVEFRCRIETFWVASNPHLAAPGLLASSALDAACGMLLIPQGWISLRCCPKTVMMQWRIWTGPMRPALCASGARFGTTAPLGTNGNATIRGWRAATTWPWQCLDGGGQGLVLSGHKARSKFAGSPRCCVSCRL
jgi:hypothetical protein